MAQPIEDQTIPALDVGEHRIRLEPSPRWVRVRLGDTWIADSKDVKLLYETGRMCMYVFPRAHVRTDLLVASDKTRDDEHKGPATFWHVRAGDREAENAAWAFEDPPPELKELADHIAFSWSKMDAWFEEDEQVYLHPRDPYHRVDVVESSRQVRVELDGVVLAETRRPRLLFETSLPTRYYIPRLDVRMDLLTPNDTSTVCPYKGWASYWDAEVNGEIHKNIVWSYTTSIPECPKIADLMCFFNERVDIFVDGEQLERPVSQWTEGISSYG